MSVTIKALVVDDETERLLEDLVRETQEPPEIALRLALSERLRRTRRAHQPAELRKRVRAIVEDLAKHPDLDTRTADEIIGYDERGLPT